MAILVFAVGFVIYALVQSVYSFNKRTLSHRFISQITAKSMLYLEFLWTVIPTTIVMFIDLSAFAVIFIGKLGASKINSHKFHWYGTTLEFGIIYVKIYFDLLKHKLICLVDFMKLRGISLVTSYIIIQDDLTFKIWTTH
jgi:hypothetical protein